MSKNLLFILNKDIAGGKVINALAHLSLGLGHYIPPTKMPGFDIKFADTHAIREARGRLSEVKESHPDETIMSDFIDTMTEGTADEQLVRTSCTKETDLTYYAVCFGAHEDTLRGIEMPKLYNMKGYKPSKPTENASFEFSCPRDAVSVAGEAEATDEAGVAAGAEVAAAAGAGVAAAGGAGVSAVTPHKAILAVIKSLPLVDALNFIVHACLQVGISAPMSSLKLLNYIDADGNEHKDVSYHPFPILKASSQPKLMAAADRAKASEKLHKCFFDNASGTVLACMFGSTEEVDGSAPRKDFSLLSIEFVAEDFVLCTGESA